MKYTYLSFLILFFGKVNAQNRIFINAGNLKDTILVDTITKIKIPWGNLGSTVITFNVNGTKSIFKKRAVWGYQIKKEKGIKRFYDGQIYSVVEMDEIIIYKSYSRHPEYFFSDNLNSSIKELSKRKIIKTVGRDRFIKEYQKSKLLRTLI